MYLDIFKGYKMQVYSIGLFSRNRYNAVNQNKINFKAKLWDDVDGIGCDGTPCGQFLRDRMLDNLYGRFPIPFQDNVEASYGLSDAMTLSDAYIKNFRVLPKSSYSGECLLHNTEFFKLLKPSGVQRVIDLKSSSKLKEMCEQCDIEYVSYDTSWGYGGQPIFKDRETILAQRAAELSKNGITEREYNCSMLKYIEEIENKNDTYLKKLVALINVVNKGNFYMSCDQGEYRTVNVLALVSTFNPKWEGEKIKPHSAYVPKMKNLYKNLTPEYKQILGIDEKYDEYLKVYLEKLNIIDIMSLGELPDSSYTGDYLQSFPEYVKRLHALEVNRVIDLCDNPKLRAACDNEGIEYSVFDTKLKDESVYIFEKFPEATISVASRVRHSVNTDNEYNREMALFKNNVKMERDAYVDNLAKLIRLVNEGHYFISSDYGMPDTANTLALVSIFNPNWQGQRMRPNPEYISKIINFYNNLSEENKKTLGIDEKYDEYLSNYIEKLA